MLHVPPFCFCDLEKNVKTFSSYADNGIVVATVDDFMQNFRSLVGYHNSITEENSLPPPPGVHERQSGNFQHILHSKSSLKTG